MLPDAAETNFRLTPLMRNRDAAPRQAQRTKMKKFEVNTHILVPKFSKLDDTEKQALFDSLNISALQLPTILTKDPIAKTVNAKVGDVLKFERSGSTGRYNYFRRVV